MALSTCRRLRGIEERTHFALVLHQSAEMRGFVSRCSCSVYDRGVQCRWRIENSSWEARSFILKNDLARLVAWIILKGYLGVKQEEVCDMLVLREPFAIGRMNAYSIKDVSVAN